MRLDRYKTFETFNPRRLDVRDSKREQMFKDQFIDSCKFGIKLQSIIDNLPHVKDERDQFVLNLFRGLTVVVPEFRLDYNCDVYVANLKTKSFLFLVRDENVVEYNYYKLIEPIKEKFSFEKYSDVKKYLIEVFEKYIIPNLRREAFSTRLQKVWDDMAEHELEFCLTPSEALKKVLK
jgi:hypothetical protein